MNNVANISHPQPQETWSRERVELIKTTFCKGATDDELNLFIGTCRRLGLSPEARQVFAVKRWDSAEKKMVMTTQVSIDGFRIVAERTGKYEGATTTEWCDKNGVWRDSWFSNEPPTAARVGVYKKGFREALFAVAHLDEYVQLKKDGTPTAMWAKMPRLMLAKCAEALALRRAFPNELSAAYTPDEMSQASGEPEYIPPQKTQAPPPQKVATVFDMGDLSMVSKLDKYLERKEIPDDMRNIVVQQMNGKEFSITNIDKILSEG